MEIFLGDRDKSSPVVSNRKYNVYFLTNYRFWNTRYERMLMDISRIYASLEVIKITRVW